jgi:hypothetical protein
MVWSRSFEMVACAMMNLSKMFALLTITLPPTASAALFGHSYIDGTEYLVNVNPVSGLVTPVGVGFPGVQSVIQSLSALDPGNRRYFFVSVELGLVTADLDTGNLVQSAELTQGLAGMEYALDAVASPAVAGKGLFTLAVLVLMLGTAILNYPSSGSSKHRSYRLES